MCGRRPGAWCRLEPFARDVVKGQQTMVPNRHDIQRMVESYYHVPRNLLVRFTDDEVDETPDVSLWLQRAAEVDTILDLTILRRPGSHTRPLRQPLPELPEDVVNVASQVRSKPTRCCTRVCVCGEACANNPPPPPPKWKAPR